VGAVMRVEGGGMRTCSSVPIAIAMRGAMSLMLRNRESGQDKGFAPNSLGTGNRHAT
jgi:hypothetical protein